MAGEVRLKMDKVREVTIVGVVVGVLVMILALFLLSRRERRRAGNGGWKETRWAPGYAYGRTAKGRGVSGEAANAPGADTVLLERRGAAVKPDRDGGRAAGEAAAPRGPVDPVGRWWPSKGPQEIALWPAVALAGLVAVALRVVNLDRSWDIFVDEISYLRLAQSVAGNFEVTLYGDAFYLHPPLFFIVEGLYLWFIHPEGLVVDQSSSIRYLAYLLLAHPDLSVIDQVYAARYLNAGLAGLSTAIVLGLGRKLGGWPVGVVAATIFALDPFVIKMNSRNYLDTSAMLWILAAYYVLASPLAGTGGSVRQRLPVWRVLVAGAFFGLALLTKDMTAFVTLLPLGVCFVLGWALPRWQTFAAGATTLLVYLPYPLVVWAIGDWRDFWYQKSRGALRLAGAFHETGFNQDNGPSFIGAILENLDEFITTYTLLGTGGISVLVIFLLARDNPLQRLFLSWVASAYTLLAYIVLRGSLEEQFFYYLIGPAILATVVAAGLLIRGEFFGPLLRRVSIVVATVVMSVFVVWSGYVWYEIHTTPDNAYERVVDYLRAEVPGDARVGVTADTAQFLIDGETGVYGSVEELREDEVEYVVMSSYLIEEGYGDASPEFYDYVRERGELVYAFEGRSFGLTGVYRLPSD